MEGDKSSLMKQIALKKLANLLAGFQLLCCTYVYALVRKNCELNTIRQISQIFPLQFFPIYSVHVVLKPILAS